MARPPVRRPAAAWLAFWLTASAAAPAVAQTRAVAPVEGFAAPVAPPASAASGGASAAILPSTLAGAPVLNAVLSAPSAFSGVPSALAAAPVAMPAPAPAAALAAEAKALTASPVRAVLVAPLVAPAAARIAGFEPQVSREAAVAGMVAGVVASWGPERSPESVGAVSNLAAASRLSEPGAPASDVAPAALPSPEKPAPGASRARPRLARAAFVAGAVLVGAAAVSFAFPALIPAALAAAKGPALYAGFALMSVSRFWRVPATDAVSPRGPPSAPTGWFKSLKVAWKGAGYAADAQVALEGRVGGSSVKSFRDWVLGGFRAAFLWMPVALAAMLAGWGIARPFARFANPDSAVGMLSWDALEKLNLGGHLLGYVAAGLSAEAFVLGVFDGAAALARRLGAGRASVWLAGAAALAVSAGLILLVTTTPSVIGTMLGIEAGLLWLRVRSGSWLAPLALRAVFSLISLEAARLGVGLVASGAAAGTLAGLPALAGLAVTGLLAGALAWSARSLRPAALWSALKAQFARVSAFGASWRTPAVDGSPKSLWPLLKLAALWGTILYAAGDLVFGGIHLIAGGTEPTPTMLVQMLTSPTDLVLYNFLLVGFLEEYVFRRGLFKSIFGRFQKWGLTGGKLFWLAAAASGLIFSYAHYIDFGSLLARFGIGAATQASGLGGMYAFTLAGFTARAALGVVLAWLYAESGTLLLPIFAHFFADSLEGLGLHWGFVPFLAMVAGSLLIQKVWKRRKPASA